MPDDLVVEVDDSDEAIVLCGWKLELSNCLSSWFLASSLFSEVGDDDVVGGDLVRDEETAGKFPDEEGGVDKRLDNVDTLGDEDCIITTDC